MKCESIFWKLTFAIVLTLPLLVFYHYPPNGSVFGDSLALLLWGVLALLLPNQSQTLGAGTRHSRHRLMLSQGLQAFVAAIERINPSRGVGLMVGLSILGWLWQTARGNYGFLSVVVTLSAAAIAGGLAFKVGESYALKQMPTNQLNKDEIFASSLMWMGVFVSSIGWIQYLRPNEFWPWISALEETGRIYANLRQPNHLALVLAWAIWGTIWWTTLDPRRYRAGMLTLLFIVPVLVFTGSRMGQVLIAVLVALSWFSPHRQRRFTFALGAAGTYICAWFFATLAAKYADIVFFGATRSTLSTGGRFDLWSQVISMLPQLPWQGCGPGQFNFCWTHAVLDARVEGTAVHAHNLILNGIVEWGWPLTLIIMGWIVLGVAKFLRCGLNTTATLPAGVFFASLIHSMLEYPWSYTYLFLPTAFAYGWMLTLSDLKQGSSSAPGLSSNESGIIPVDDSTTLQQRLRHLTYGFLPGLVLIGFGMAYATQYWQLRVLFADGHARQLLSDELREVNNGAALFSMPLSYAMATRITADVEPQDASSLLVYLKQAGRGTEDPAFISRFAVVAALAGENTMAQHLAWRAIQMDPNQHAKLVQRVAQLRGDVLFPFATYLVRPYPVNLDRAAFVN